MIHSAQSDVKIMTYIRKKSLLKKWLNKATLNGSTGLLSRLNFSAILSVWMHLGMIAF